MSGGGVQTGVTLLHQGLTGLHTAAGPHGSKTDRIAVLNGLAAVEQQLQRVIVDTAPRCNATGRSPRTGNDP